MSSVRFHYSGIFSIPISDKTRLKNFILELFKDEHGILSSLTYVFATDAVLLALNKKYLNHDTMTDIITFDLSSNSQEITGEVYISVERVKENSRFYKTRLRDELLRVIFHGALHLCGYKDKKKSEITIMRQKEDHYLRLFEEELKQGST